MTEAKFQRFDTDKIRWSLLPRSVMRDIVKVLEYGAKKYSPNNWKKAGNPEDLERCWNSFDRHRDALQLEGQYYDAETNLPHTAHMLCNLMFIHYLQEEKQNDHNETSQAGATN